MLKWGIVGTGGIARKFAQTLNALGDNRLYGVASRTTKKAQEFALEHNISKFYGSYEELCKDPEVDIVYIATPMTSHYHNAKLCFKYNKHVLCEKAITVNSKQLVELIDIAEAKNLFLMEAMWTKTLPMFREIREIVNSGEIGEVKVIKADLSNLVTVDYESRLFANGLGGGALLDVSVYLLSFATAILGNKPLSINSSAYIRNGIDFDNHITLQYRGAYADLSAGMSAYSPNRATIIGTKGLIQTSEHFYQAKKLSVYDCDYNFRREVPCNFDYTGFEYQILECEKMIKQHKITSELHPLKDSLSVMNIIDTCKQQWNLSYPGDENF